MKLYPVMSQRYRIRKGKIGCISGLDPLGHRVKAGRPPSSSSLSLHVHSLKLFTAVFVVSHFFITITKPLLLFAAHRDHRESSYLAQNCGCLSIHVGASSEEPAVFEIVLDDDVRDGVEHEPNVVGVGRAREVGVHLLLVLALVEVLELHLDVGRRVLVRVRA